MRDPHKIIRLLEAVVNRLKDKPHNFVDADIQFTRHEAPQLDGLYQGCFQVRLNLRADDLTEFIQEVEKPY